MPAVMIKCFLFTIPTDVVCFQFLERWTVISIVLDRIEARAIGDGFIKFQTFLKILRPDQDSACD